VDPLWQVVLTATGGIVVSIVGYMLGRRAKIDEKRIERAFAEAENVAVLFQDIHDLEKTLSVFYEMNFADRPVEEAVDVLERLNASYQQQHEEIRTLSEKRHGLNGALRAARVYLKPDITSDIQEYLDIGLFRYATDGGIMTNTYTLEFFRNLIEPTNRERRVRLADRIFRRLHKLVQ